MKKTALRILLCSALSVSTILSVSAISDGARTYYHSDYHSGVYTVCSGSSMGETDSYECATHSGCTVTVEGYDTYECCTQCGYVGSTGITHTEYYRHSAGVDYCVCPYNESVASVHNHN